MKTGSLALFVFVFVGIVWGSNFIFMKLAVELITPMQVVLVRVLFGFIPVLIYAFVTKSIKFEHLKLWPHFLVMSLLATAIYYYAFVKATAVLPSGIAGAISGTIPLSSFIFASLFLNKLENITFIKFMGVIIGFVGILLIADPFSQSQGSSVQGILYMLFGSISVGSSFVYARKFLSDKPIKAQALTTYQLGLALIILFALTDLNGVEQITSDLQTFTAAAIGLGLFGTGFAFIAYYYLVKRLGAVKAATATYLPPVVALLIGAFIGEDISAIDYLGAALIIASVVFLNKEK